MADFRAYQPSYTAGELSPALWARVDLSKYTSGLKTARNIFIHPHGGASNRAGLQFIREVKDSSKDARLIPFSFSTEQTYILELGDLYGRVYRDDGIVLSGGVPYEFVTPYTHADLALLTFIQEADVMYLCHPLYAPRKLSRSAETNWTVSLVTFAPTIAAPAGVSAVRLVGAAGSNVNYKVAAVDDESGEESLPSAAATISSNLSIAGNKNRVSWSAVAGAGRYIVYKEDNGVYGYIGGTSGLTFDDENINPDTADTPQTARNPFSGAGNYPRCATFVEQRLAFGGTINNPQGIWLSQSANYENFGYASPSKPTDAITIRIKARQVNEIRAMLPLRGLMVLTSGGEFIVSGGSEDFLTPANPKITPQGYRGGALVQPIIVGNTVLFAQRLGGVARDFSYEFTEDSFVGRDLTILARHLFETKVIKAWAYAQAPHSIVWVVLDDGSLVSMTYMKEHEVWAWTRHDSSGAVFEDVAVIEQDGEDVPYFLVKRTIDGTPRRFIERLHTRKMDSVVDAFFVDSGLSYSGAPVSTITLAHLPNQTVNALVDGNVVTGITLDGAGVGTLPQPGSVIHAGLPYEAELKTLDLDIGSVQGLGSVQARLKGVSQLSLRVENTRGIWISTRDFERGDNHCVEFVQRSTEAWDEAIQLLTGDISIRPMWSWTPGGTVVIKQFDPLPMTILAHMPDITLGR